MPIEIYPSKIDGAPIETHQTNRRMTVEKWLTETIPSYTHEKCKLISVTVNSCIVQHDEYASCWFSPGDHVCIYVEPKGAELIIAAVTIGAALTAITAILTPKIPKAREGASTSGEDIGLSAAKGNRVKINSPIREIAGRHLVYPDYLIPLRRYFVDQKEQWVDMLLCVGVGKFDLPTALVKIGDTTVPSLGSDAILNIYQPGASLASDPAAIWWHTAPEVGATSTGTAGLDLRSIAAYTKNAEFTSANYSGTSVTIPTGAGSFPANWVAGIILRIDVRYPYTISDGTGTGGRDVINGSISALGLPNGALIEITGDNAGDYIIFSQTAGTLQLNYADGSPATGLTGAGTVNMGISYRGMNYEILTVTSSTITLDRLTDTGAVDGGWPGFATLTSTTSTISVDDATGEENWAGPYPACPEGEVTNQLEFDVLFPQGLFQINKYNNPVAFPVTVSFEYRDIAIGGAWTAVNKTYNGGSVDQIGFTEVVNLGSSFRPECRMRRITLDSASAQVSDAVQWYGLRSRLVAPTSYADVTTLTLRVRGGNRLATESEQLVSVEPTRILPIRISGAEAGEAPTRDIAPFVRYICKSVGYTDDDIDLDELDRLDDIWKARGDFFDATIDGSETVKSAIVDALTCGFADLTIDRGKIRPVRDEIRTTFEHMYTPQNMASPLRREFTSFTADDFDGVDVEYVDEVTWQVETVECRLPGDLGTRVEKIQATGVTNRDRAWRIGMRQRRSQKYRRKTFSFDTELDALNSRYLSFCALGDDVPGYGQSAIMLSYSAGVIESSEPFDWSAGGTHMVAVRRTDGTLSGPYVATRIDDTHLSITGLDFVPDTSWDVEPPHLLFGPVASFSYPVLITDISPSGSTGASVSAVNYDVRVYADDDGFAPD